MISLVGLGCKGYEEHLGGGLVPEVSCPDPACGGAALRGHGWYRRYLAGLRRRIRRLCCPRCGVSHALLPEDVCAYRDVLLGAVEAALTAPGPSAGAQATGQAGSSGVRRVRGWRRSGEAVWVEQLKALLPAVEGPWWQRGQRVVGPAAGWLVRLRHWLWSSFGCFLGGLAGLYRHGRPRHRPAGASPYFGSWASP